MKKVSFYLFILLISISCNSVKRLADNEHLLKKSTIYVDKKKNKNNVLNDYVVQKPNSKVLGFPLSLYFYNLGNQKNSKTPKEWGTRNPKSYRFFKNLFSEKQSIAAAKAFIGINNWFLNSGETPVIIDDLKTKRTANNLSAYFITQGYFKNKVTIQKDTLNNKKGKLSYYIEKGKPLFLDTITKNIPSAILDSIYNAAAGATFLKSGDQYKDQNFRKEAARLIKLYRNSGIYNFAENFIGFDADTTRADNKTNILLTVSDNYYVEENGKQVPKPFAIKRISSVNIYTDYEYTKKDEAYLDTLKYQGTNYIAHTKVRYNPKYLSQSVFIKPNQIYSDTLRNLTRFHLRSLNNFKAINIRYVLKDNNLLEANIFFNTKRKIYHKYRNRNYTF